MKFKNYTKLLGIGMIVSFNYIGKILNGSIQEVKSKGKKPMQFLQKNCINKGYRASIWVVHSYLKQLDINDLFERKHTIEDMGAELTSNTDNSAVAEGANVHEAVTAESKASKDM